MVESSQTEHEVKIIIKLINITSRRPDVVLLKRYIKFNCPPTFFEAHLVDDIDEEKSYCKLFKREARIILKKVNSGIWENIFVIPENKKIALEKRKEMVDELQKKNVAIEEQAVKKFDQKRRSEVEREINRESKLREKFEVANEKCLEKELGVTAEDTKKIKDREEREKKKKQKNFKDKFIKDDDNEEYEKLLEEEQKEEKEKLERQEMRHQYIGPKISKTEANALLEKMETRKQIRQGGNIRISFTKFGFKTPKRESQREIQEEILRRKLIQENKCKSSDDETDDEQNSGNLENVD